MADPSKCKAPYCGFGTGGWCSCNCGCIAPNECYTDYYWTYTVTRGTPCDDGTQTITSNLTYDGCCLLLSSYSDTGFLKYWSFYAMGSGTISITNAYTEFANYCGFELPEAKAGMKFGINTNYLLGPGTITYNTTDCELIGITLVLDVNPCCSFGVDDFGGNKYESCVGGSFRRNSQINNLKRQIFSRIKKVHYKP